MTSQESGKRLDRYPLRLWLGRLLFASVGVSALATLGAAAQTPAPSVGSAQPPSPTSSVTQAVSPDEASAALPQSPAPAADAEGTASIYGLIADVNGGIVPGATVSIVNAAGKPARQAQADAAGDFRLDHLPAGTYRLRISATGLQTFQPPPITLRDGQSYKLPETALPIATATTSIDVVLTRTQVAEIEMKDETRQRVIGILPNFYTSYVWNAAPLNAHQKFYLSFRACTDPWVFLRTGITAGIQQARGTFPEYGSGPTGYLERYGAAYGDAVVGRVIGSAVLTSVFHQDPRYFYRGTGGVTRRTLHALFSSVVARSDKGNIQPNYTRTLGDFSSGYISRTWHPGSNNGFSLALDNMLSGIGNAAAHNLAQEFLFKHISRGTPPFAKGKPPEQKESPLHP